MLQPAYPSAITRITSTTISVTCLCENTASAPCSIASWILSVFNSLREICSAKYSLLIDRDAFILAHRAPPFGAIPPDHTPTQRRYPSGIPVPRRSPPVCAGCYFRPMQASCTHCGTQHVLKDTDVGTHPKVQFRCSRCGRPSIVE